MPAINGKHGLLYEGSVLMEGIHKYILSVISAGVVCAVVNLLIGKKGTHSALIRLISGLFMALSLISPLVNIKLSNYKDYFQSFSEDADTAVAAGESAAENELRSIIKSQVEAYILDKAVSMDTVLNVEVTLNNDNPPIPCGVTLIGSVSPYTKEVLSKYITRNLQIPKEDQVWIHQASD